MAKISKNKIFLFIILCIWGAGLSVFYKTWSSNLKSPGIEPYFIQNIITNNEDYYLASYRDTHLGCESIVYRDPDIIFFGDSHSYAGWDYNELQQLFAPLKVGACAYAGSFPENINHLLDLIEREHMGARYIIVGTSPRMFWDVEEKEARIERAQAQYASLSRAPKENVFNLTKGHLVNFNYDSQKGKEIKDKILRLKSSMDNFNYNVQDILAHHQEDMGATAYWLDYIKEAKPFLNYRELLERIYKRSKELHLKFVFHYIPESEWLNAHYTDTQKKHFLEVNSYIESLGFPISLDYFNKGYSNNFYINRYLLDDYPYNVWNNYDALKSWVNEEPKNRKWHIFDPDHLNALGAIANSKEFNAKFHNYIVNKNL